MKKLFLFLLLCSIISAQEGQTKSLLELKLQTSQIPNSETALNNFSVNIQPDVSKKNPGLAILYSLLLPGMGELYAEDYRSGKYFTIADGVLWGVFAGFNSYGNWKENNYKSFAQAKAGVDVNNKEANYFANLGVYLSVDDYNKEQELNRDFVNTYNNPSDYWKWQNDNDRKEYRNLWSSSESAFNNVRFAVGALILNRLISAINAVRLVSAYNKNLKSDSELSYYFSYQQLPTLPSSVKINIVKSF